MTTLVCAHHIPRLPCGGIPNFEIFTAHKIEIRCKVSEGVGVIFFNHPIEFVDLLSTIECVDAKFQVFQRRMTA